MSKFFEDFVEGDAFERAAASPVTAALIEDYARLSGDMNRIHVDEDFARRSPFGRRIAHGLLGLSLASGLLHELGVLAETVVAFSALDWKFRAPVLIGDTISLRMSVGKKKSMGPRAGLVVFDASLRNQRGEALQEGTWSLTVKKKA